MDKGGDDEDEDHDCVHDHDDHDDHDVFLGGGCLFKDGFPVQTSTTQEVSYMGRTIMGEGGIREGGLLIYRNAKYLHPGKLSDRQTVDTAK